MSVEKAITNLNKLAQMLEDGTIAKMVAKAAENEAIGTYMMGAANGEGWSVETIDNGNGNYTVRASGPQIGFLEFGTGVRAGRVSDNYRNIPSGFDSPGSWSETHARTYQQWEAAGLDMDNYPYNRIPVPGMSKGRKAAMDKLEEIVRRALAE